MVVYTALFQDERRKVEQRRKRLVGTIAGVSGVSVLRMFSDIAFYKDNGMKDFRSEGVLLAGKAVEL